MVEKNGKTVQALEQEMRTQEDLKGARLGIIAHAIVYAVVAFILAIVNMTFVTDVIWFIFPVAGMTIGLIMHYFFGFFMMKKRTRLAS
jgi:hypothetical protein